MSQLLALHGRRGAGKDTAFGYIQGWCAERGLRAVRRGFADYVKWSFVRMFVPDMSMSEAVMWSDRLKHCGSLRVLDWTTDPETHEETKLSHEIPMRLAFQRFATEGHRDIFGEDFWVDALLPTTTFEMNGEEHFNWEHNFDLGSVLSQAEGPPDFCVITDLRFENEAKRVHQLGGRVWQVNRPLEHEDNHSSEQPLNPVLVDQEIENDGSMAAFERLIWNAMDNHYGEVLKP